MLVQVAVTQSLAIVQARPTAQSPQEGPPQSTSVSWPFLMLSVHEPAPAQWPRVQVPDAQSVPMVQI